MRAWHATPRPMLNFIAELGRFYFRLSTVQQCYGDEPRIGLHCSEQQHMDGRFASTAPRRTSLWFSSVSIVLLGSMLSGAAPQAPAPQEPVFRGAANLVLVDAYPQKDGHIVEGLTAADFDVFED